MMPDKARDAHEWDVIAGEIVKSIRKKRRFSRPFMSRKLLEMFNVKVSFQQLHKYEIGQNRMSLSRFMQICKVLNTPNESMLREINAEISRRN